MFFVRRASERAQEECSKFCLLERAPLRLLFFDFKLRNLFEGCALWIKSQQQNCVFRKGAAELICVRLYFKAVLFREIYGFDSILSFYYICGQFLLNLWSIIAFVTSTVSPFVCLLLINGTPFTYQDQNFVSLRTAVNALSFKCEQIRKPERGLLWDLKVARYSFLGSIPPTIERKLRRH